MALNQKFRAIYLRKCIWVGVFPYSHSIILLMALPAIIQLFGGFGINLASNCKTKKRRVGFTLLSSKIAISQWKLIYNHEPHLPYQGTLDLLPYNQLQLFERKHPLLQQQNQRTLCTYLHSLG